MMQAPQEGGELSLLGHEADKNMKLPRQKDSLVGGDFTTESDLLANAYAEEGERVRASVKITKEREKERDLTPRRQQKEQDKDETKNLREALLNGAKKKMGYQEGE